MLNCLKLIADQAGARGVPVTVCGEMAGRPIEAMALIGLGFRSLSMAPASIGPVKQMVLALNSERIGALMDDLLRGTAHSLREQLRQFAINERVPV
jgi:phosphotransferase system enzyme I (PtsP)